MTQSPSPLRFPQRFGAIMADPPWRFANRTGKMAPEHRRLHRYRTMTLAEICAMPVADAAAVRSHLYLWCPNALLAWGLEVVRAWGFEYKTNIVWLKVRKDGGPDGRGVGFYYRNVTELVLFAVRGGLRTLPPGRRMVNLIATMKEKHSKKPEEIYDMVEHCSPGPYLELFARSIRPGWAAWGDQAPVPARQATNSRPTPRPMEGGMIRPYRLPQMALFR